MNLLETLPNPKVLNASAPKSMPVCVQMLSMLHLELEKASMIPFMVLADDKFYSWQLCVSMDILGIKPTGCSNFVITQTLIENCDCIKKRKRESNFWKN